MMIQKSSGIKGIFSVHSCTTYTKPTYPSVSRFELFPHTKTFSGKPEPLYTTQYSDLFVTYQEGFNMHTGQPKPQSIINEYISGKRVLDSTTKQQNTLYFQH